MRSAPLHAGPSPQAQSGPEGRAAGADTFEPAGADSALDVVRENLVAFSVAIVMALVIKHFCLEAFRIPTSSMWPTLHGEGDAGQDRQEDRIVVDKWAYVLGGPERGDVMVFRYPLDRSRNFIKRVAGLGGEWMRIAEGDVWVRRDPGDPWRPATKRRRVREQLYTQSYPPAPGAGGLERPTGTWWETEEGLDGWRLESLDRAEAARFEYEGGARSRLRYVPTLHAQGSQSARDLRVRVRVLPKGPGTLTLSWAPEGGWRTDLALVIAEEAGAPSEVVFRQGSEPAVHEPLRVRLRPGRPTALEWEVVDGQVHVHVDGVEQAVVPFDRAVGGSEGRQALSITAEGAPLTLEGLRIDHDLHYSLGGGDRHRPELGSPQGLRVPDDSYFMLGDNTFSSSDSRAWEAGGVRLRDGREIWWNLSGHDGTGPSHVRGSDERRVVDVDGVERRWHDDEEAEDLPRRWLSFVPRENVVGRAFYIFWPAWPEFPRRLRWIH